MWKPGTKEMLDDMHLRKIVMADEIYVINVDGSIPSTSLLLHSMNIITISLISTTTGLRTLLPSHSMQKSRLSGLHSEELGMRNSSFTGSL